VNCLSGKVFAPEEISSMIKMREVAEDFLDSTVKLQLKTTLRAQNNADAIVLSATRSESQETGGERERRRPRPPPRLLSRGERAALRTANATSAAASA
jgi:hypothetical protein